MKILNGRAEHCVIYWKIIFSAELSVTAVFCWTVSARQSASSYPPNPECKIHSSTRDHCDRNNL